jgi:hypothetical protein
MRGSCPPSRVRRQKRTSTSLRNGSRARAVRTVPQRTPGVQDEGVSCGRHGESCARRLVEGEGGDPGVGAVQPPIRSTLRGEGEQGGTCSFEPSAAGPLHAAVQGTPPSPGARSSRNAEWDGREREGQRTNRHLGPARSRTGRVVTDERTHVSIRRLQIRSRGNVLRPRWAKLGTPQRPRGVDERRGEPGRRTRLCSSRPRQTRLGLGSSPSHEGARIGSGTRTSPRSVDLGRAWEGPPVQGPRARARGAARDGARVRDPAFGQSVPEVSKRASASHPTRCEAARAAEGRTHRLSRSHALDGTEAARVKNEGAFPPADARTYRPEEGTDDGRRCHLVTGEVVGSLD